MLPYVGLEIHFEANVGGQTKANLTRATLLPYVSLEFISKLTYGLTYGLWQINEFLYVHKYSNLGVLHHFALVVPLVGLIVY